MNQSPNTSVINLPGVQWWLKKRRTYLMRNFLMIFIILGIMGFAFSQLNLRELETPELIFLLDDSIEYSIHMEAKLKEIHKADEERRAMFPESAQAEEVDASKEDDIDEEDDEEVEEEGQE